MTTAHKTRNPLFIVFTCGILCVSCLREGAVGEGATYQLEVSETSISVPADSPDQPVVEKTLSITSNRSWSAYCDPAVDWLTLSVEELENIARIQEKTDVTLIFDNNEDRTATRETELVVSTAEGSLRIPVRQGKQVPYIQLLTPAAVDNLSCMEEVSVVRFASNIEWVASIEAGATAQVAMDKSGGKYDGEISLTFAENEDTESTPEAVLVLDDPQGGLEAPVKVHFKQGKALPYITWKSGDQVYKGSIATSLVLDFKTNTAWTAALETPVEGITLPVTSGEKTVNQFTVNLNDFSGLANERNAKVVLSVEGGENAVLNIRQIASGFVLNFIEGNQPFTTDIPYGEKVAGKETEYTFSCASGDYNFTFFSTEGYTFVNGKANQTCGLMTYKNDWVKLPGVEGWKLKSVDVYTSNMGSSANKGFGLRETTSGNNLVSQYVLAHDAVCNLVLANPDSGKSYYLVSLNNTGYYSKLYLAYEQ